MAPDLALVLVTKIVWFVGFILSFLSSAGKSRAQAREDRDRAQARAREPLTGEPYEL